MILFTGLDGSRLDEEDYSFTGAESTLERIRRSWTPLIFTTSKTRREVESLQTEMGFREPFIVENGGGVFFPRGYRGLTIEGAQEVADYRLIPLGVPYARDKPGEGLIRMAADIAKVLFRVLSQDGLVMSGAFFRTLMTAYMQESRIAIEKYHALALLNGLTYDRHEEIEAVDAFVDSLKIAIKGFVKDPLGIPMLAAWVRVEAAISEFAEKLQEAVEKDNL